MIELRKAILTSVAFFLAHKLSLLVLGLLVHEVANLSPISSRNIFNILYSWHKLHLLLCVAIRWQSRLVDLEILIHLLLVPLIEEGLLHLRDNLVIGLT
jgi:hypothetical protein